LGVWEGSYQNQTQRWLRWWDNQGNLLLTGSEQAKLERLHTEQERQRADAESQRAEAERERADREQQQKERLAAYLRSQGIEPDLI
jgi:transposase-like protein